MKKIILSFLLGAMIFGTAGAYAAGGNMIEVFYNIKDIKINKVSKMPYQKPFTYQGSTYVPLRYISEELGMPVKWEASTQTIHIGQMNEANAFYPGKDLNHMNYQSGHDYHSFDYKYNSTNIIKDNIGNEYQNYLSLIVTDWGTIENAWNLIEFPLNGQYKNFITKVGLTDSSKDTKAEGGKLQILADGKVIKEVVLKAGDMPVDINLNINNANKITFKLSALEGKRDRITVGLFNARFLK